MNPNLKGLVEEFERAINESVCESDRIAALVTEMKRAGYDITLVLEATIGVTASAESQHTEGVNEFHGASNGEISLTSEDEQFLRGLHISAS